MKSKIKGNLEKNKGEDSKMVKPSQILECITDVWNVIIDSYTEELYVESFILFIRFICKVFGYFEILDI